MLTKDELKVVMGKNIRRERLARNLRLSDLSPVLGIDPAAVGLMERGVRGVTAISCYRLAVLFDVSYDVLFRPCEDDPAESGSNLDILRKRFTSMINVMDEKELNIVLSVLKGIYELRSREEDENEIV